MFLSSSQFTSPAKGISSTIMDNEITYDEYKKAIKVAIEYLEAQEDKYGKLDNEELLILCALRTQL